MSSNDAKGATPNIMKINMNAGVTDAWLKMQQSTLMMNKAMMPDVNKMIPDMSKFAMPVLTDSTINRMAELSKKMAEVATQSFPTENLERMQKLVAQETSGLDSLTRQIYENQVALSKMLDPSLSALKLMSYDDRLQKSIAAMASTFTASMDTSRIQELLATATTLRQGLTDQDVDELTDEFFAAHPDLAGSLDESPALYALSRTDRRLIVWFVGIIVTLYVGNALLYIGTDFPELKGILDAFGLDLGGGVSAGASAAAATNKALDKLPQEEAE